jgi:hypothetical protein
MNLLQLAWRLLVAQPLTLALSVLVLALGWAAVGFVMLTSDQIEGRVQRDLAGIDLVVGAKGSPMQIMLSGVFHLDVPTGNIPLATWQTLRDQPLVAEVWPLSLGDSLQGWRIVGSTPQYLDLFGARLREGARWTGPMQAVLGSEVARATGLKVGDRFAGNHGLGGSGDAHGDSPFEVVGVLERGGSVLDRLVLTDLTSVWQVHETLHEVDEEDRATLEAERQVTMLLVRYRSPLGAAMLPRWVNAQEGLQSAAPALESARLLRMLGGGARTAARLWCHAAGGQQPVALHHPADHGARTRGRSGAAASDGREAGATCAAGGAAGPAGGHCLGAGRPDAGARCAVGAGHLAGRATIATAVTLACGAVRTLAAALGAGAGAGGGGLARLARHAHRCHPPVAGAPLK